MSVWICMIVGLLIGLITVSAMKSQLKSVHMQGAASNYLTQGSLNLVISTDHFLYENTTRTPKVKNNKK